MKATVTFGACGLSPIRVAAVLAAFVVLMLRSGTPMNYR